VAGGSRNDGPVGKANWSIPEAVRFNEKRPYVGDPASYMANELSSRRTWSSWACTARKAAARSAACLAAARVRAVSS
jgi:hypothetical protein